MTNNPADTLKAHQSTMKPEDNKFHKGNGIDQKHYWLTPPDVYEALNAEHKFDFDPCPFPKPEDFDGLTCEWGQSSYVNPPFGSIMHNGKKKGATAWARKAIEENKKGKRVVLVHPMDKWVLMMIAAGAKITNLGDVKWLATEDGSAGKGTGRHIACFVLEPETRATSEKPTGDALDTDDYIVALIAEYTKNHVRDIERFIGALKACGYVVVKANKPTGDRVAALEWLNMVEDASRKGITYWRGKGDSESDAETCEERIKIIATLKALLTHPAPVTEEK